MCYTRIWKYLPVQNVLEEYDIRKILFYNKSIESMNAKRLLGEYQIKTKSCQQKYHVPVDLCVLEVIFNRHYKNLRFLIVSTK